jgi:hypothetical protein
MRFQVEFRVPDDDPVRVVFHDDGMNVVVPEGQRSIAFTCDQEDVLRAVLNARAEKRGKA